MSTDHNEAMRLADRISPETDWYEFDQVTWCNEAAALLRQLSAERDQLRAEVERLRVDGERYQVLRCYELGGAWPDGFKAPAGLLVFSGGLTQHELDKVLDDMLGHLPHPSPGSVRADYQQWRRSQTLSAVAAIDAARTTHKETE